MIFGNQVIYLRKFLTDFPDYPFFLFGTADEAFWDFPIPRKYIAFALHYTGILQALHG